MKNTKENKVIIKYKLNIFKSIRLILIMILLTIFIYCFISISVELRDMRNNRKDIDNLIKEVIIKDEDVENEVNPTTKTTTKINNLNPENIKIDFKKLYVTNEDTKGWMIFNNFQINNPLVQSNDNSHYLTHNFYNQKNSLGTLFIDHRVKSFDDKNVIIFGHASKDRTMFGSLVDVFKSSFFNQKNNDIIYIYDTNNNLLKYKIFSYYTIESEEYYIKTQFSNEDEYLNWLNEMKARSIRNLDVELNRDDRILTLSTCAGSRGTKIRRVIHAKRV